MAYKPCNRCGQDIGFRKDGGRIVPINPDGTPHHCNPAPAAQPEKENALIGIYQGITFKRISIVRKDKKILSSGCTKRLLDYLAEPGILLKVGMKVKVVFAKDGNADVIEICPDQPVTEQQPTSQSPKTAQTQTAPQQETRTSPESSATAEKPDTFSEREEFCNLLTSTGREGMPALLQYLVEKTDFFTAPSSAKHHDAVPGGLLHHSLKTYRHLVTLSRTFAVDCPEDSLKIIGLLHDLCKVNFYVTTTRNVKKKDKSGFSEWVEEPYIDIEDQLPLGHGEKSVIMLQRYVQLTDTEIMGIRWHMMSYDDVAHSYAGNLVITNASGKYPIIPLMHIADLSASFLEMRLAGGA